jgi:hypothetical protein
MKLINANEVLEIVEWGEITMVTIFYTY